LRRELQAGIEIRVVEVTPGSARIGITAPLCVTVVRPERFSADDFEKKQPKRRSWAHKLIARFWS
jgi:sRNA-binding carbon storage regulator CsrA